MDLTSEFPFGSVSDETATGFAESLSAEEKAVFEATPAAGELLDALREIREADSLHKKSSVSRKAAEALLPFIAGLEQYGKAIDVFANSSDLLCPIWGSIRVLLHIGRQFGEYFDKLSAMMEEIGQVLSRVPRCRLLYPENKNLRDAVVAIYRTIFEFCTRARQVFRLAQSRSGGIKSIRNAVGFTLLLWKPFSLQFGDIKSSIANGVSAIEAEADLAEKELASEERHKNNEHRTRAERAQDMLVEYIDDQSMVKVNEWLSPANVATNHKAATSLRHADSGSWFLRGDAFQNWLENDNSFLWLHAIPGAGKTVLASSIINYLQENYQSQSTGLAYFYCDYKDPQKQEPSKVLGTVLATLSKQNRAVFEEIQKFFLQQYRETSTFTATADELLNNFNNFVGNHFESIIIVVDALDEAGTGNWECLTDALTTLHQDCHQLKILVTSRNELQIAQTFKDLPKTSIEQADVASDIRDFIAAELASKIAKRKLKLGDPGLEAVIRETLLEGAKGMFQWAKCQIEALCKLRNDKAIRAALSNLPKTLQDTYLRILQRVEDEYPEDVETVRKILCWLARGIRYLTLEELAEARAVDPEADDTSMDFTGVDNDPEDILEQLGGLVTVSNERVISLAHFSVKEFLVSNDIKKAKPTFWVGEEDVEAQLAAVCLTYLCYDDFNHPLMPDVDELQARLGRYKLLRYATQAWAIHAQRSEREGRQEDLVVGLTMRLFQAQDEAQGNFESWIECYRHFKFSRQILKRPANPLLCAAHFGLSEATAQLLEECDDSAQLAEPLRAAAAGGHVSVVKHFLGKFAGQAGGEEKEDAEQAVKAYLGQALYLAAAKGHTELVSLLLDHGVDINQRGGRDGTALQAAALEGRVETVRLLLSRGANHWESCKRFGTPLAAAAEKAHERTVAVLLEYDANPNGRGGWHLFPLVSAIVGKNMNIVRCLIERGADLNSVGGRHGGPLAAAAATGMRELVSELVDRGAMVNDEDDKASDALYAASLAGHADIVDLLLELGADVDAKGGRHKNALGAASSEGHLDIVRTLLDAGASTSYFDEHWGNALQTAAQHGHHEVVRALAEAGVDPNAEAGDKGTALVRAAGGGHDGVLEVLLDVGSSGEDDMAAAMVAAASGGYDSAIQLLADNGGDVDTVNWDASDQLPAQCSPLQAAAYSGSLACVELLLRLGADAGEQDEGYFGTPLMAAVNSSRRSLELVTALIEAGADVNEESPDECQLAGFPLVHAVQHEDADCVNLLLDSGADVNVNSGTFVTSIQMAATLEDDAMLELLIERGADVNITTEPEYLEDEIEYEEDLDEGPITALQSAAWEGHVGHIRRLRGLGAELSVSVDDAVFSSALQAAAYRGHTSAVSTLIELGSEVDEIGGYFGSALQAAVSRGHLETARVLLDAGAQAEEQDVGYYHSALLAACARDDNESSAELVRLLVERGAGVNTKQKGDFPCALHMAARHLPESEFDTLNLLIELGADVNARGGKYGTALQAAAADGTLDAVDILLDHGADPNLTGGWYHTPLQAAYRQGFYLVIGRLYRAGAVHTLMTARSSGSVLGEAIGCDNQDDDLESGGACDTLINGLLFRVKFDVNAEYGHYGNALQNVVARRRDQSVFDMVLRAGADVNRVGGHMGTALTAAAYYDDMEELVPLLEAGADVNLGNHLYPNAAFGAIHGKRRKALERLLEAGADVVTPVGKFGTALQGAALSGRLDHVRMLIRRGAAINPEPPCGAYGTPLQAAVCRNHTPVVRYLLRRGADIHAKGGRLGSILHAAALNCDEDTVELLLKKGAGVNERGAVYGSPLQAACARGSVEMALLLLRHGADINQCGGKYWTALQAACASGDLVLIRMLVERGADVSLAGGIYRTPLQAAAIIGYEEIVRYLLDEVRVEWRLMDREALKNVSASRLDSADETMEDIRNPPGSKEWATDDESDGEDKDEDEDEDGEDTRLPLNVESIPGACERYAKPSKWNTVRDNSLHSLKGTNFTAEVEHALLASKSRGARDRHPEGLPIRNSAQKGDPPGAGRRTWDADVLEWVQVESEDEAA